MLDSGDEAALDEVGTRLLDPGIKLLAESFGVDEIDVDASATSDCPEGEGLLIVLVGVVDSDEIASDVDEGTLDEVSGEEDSVAIEDANEGDEETVPAVSEAEMGLTASAVRSMYHYTQCGHSLIDE